MLLFISTMLADRIKGGTHFNTSHVTVYLVRMWFWKWHIHFNTSHVTVYRKTWREAVSCYIRISIHLMLLFIPFALRYLCAAFAFQYISCYCLSIPYVLIIVIKFHFNTSHVTVYLFLLHRLSHTNAISIHLMLLFISF